MEMAETAQDTYKRFQREQLAPALREMGFRGSSPVYVFPDDLNWLQVGLQASRHSDRSSVMFTVNLGITSKHDWHRFREGGFGFTKIGDRPSPNAVWPVGHTWRLGPLAVGYDKWWEVNAGDDVGAVSDEVTGLIRTVGLPWLLNHVADPDYYKKVQAPT
jgi:hypothetical protein